MEDAVCCLLTCRRSSPSERMREGGLSCHDHSCQRYVRARVIAVQTSISKDTPARKARNNTAPGETVGEQSALSGLSLPR